MSNLKISKDEFIEICLDTLTLVPIRKTAARLNRSVPTVHMNRHKFLAVLEEVLDEENTLWIVKLFAVLKSDYLRLSDERIQILFA
jgi:hypothetical protein